MHPLLLLAVGVSLVLVGILWVRMSAFVSLIVAALCVSLLSPGQAGEAVGRVTVSFGNAVGKIGLVIAFAAVIGRAMTQSGAALRLVKALSAAFGPKRAPWALMVSGYVLSIPVFFDTVFYLLLPLARVAGRAPGGRTLYGLLAIVAGAAITHTLVPPTPGPLAMAIALQVDVGVMIGVGALVAVPATIVAMALARTLDRHIDISDLVPANAGPGIEGNGVADTAISEQSRAPLEHNLPGLFSSLLPVVLPVALIGWGTSQSMRKTAAAQPVEPNAIAAVLSHPAVALGLAMFAALLVLKLHHNNSRVSELIDEALRDGGTIILITASGSAFGASLQAAGVGVAVQQIFGESSSGFGLLAVAFALASMLKAAQGSSTAAMVVGSSMMAAMLDGLTLSFHPVYLCTALGGGALVGSWMNDSGFWLFCTMGGLGERRTLQTWTPLLACLGVTTFASTLLLAWLLPLV